MRNLMHYQDKMAHLFLLQIEGFRSKKKILRCEAQNNTMRVQILLAMLIKKINHPLAPTGLFSGQL